MATRFADHLLDGTHAARPTATTVPEGTLYSCSDHSLVYQSDGATWSTWATLGGSGGSSAYTKAYRSTTQSLTNGSWNVLNWDAEAFDPSTMHDLGSNTNRLTIPTGQDGIYVIAAVLFVTADATGIRAGQILKNSTTVNTNLLGQASMAGFAGVTNAMNIIAMASLAAGDYVGVVCYVNQNSLNLLVDSSFQAYRIA